MLTCLQLQWGVVLIERGRSGHRRAGLRENLSLVLSFPTWRPHWLLGPKPAPSYVHWGLQVTECRWVSGPFWRCPAAASGCSGPAFWWPGPRWLQPLVDVPNLPSLSRHQASPPVSEDDYSTFAVKTETVARTSLPTYTSLHPHLYHFSPFSLRGESDLDGFGGKYVPMKSGKPGLLQSMGSQRVGHDRATELSWWSHCPHQNQKYLSPPQSFLDTLTYAINEY